MAIVTCPHCGFCKDIEQKKLPSGSVKVTCPKCHQAFTWVSGSSQAQPQEIVAPPKTSETLLGEVTVICPHCGLQRQVKKNILPRHPTRISCRQCRQLFTIPCGPNNACHQGVAPALSSMPSAIKTKNDTLRRYKDKAIPLLNYLLIPTVTTVMLFICLFVFDFVRLSLDSQLEVLSRNRDKEKQITYNATVVMPVINNSGDWFAEVLRFDSISSIKNGELLVDRKRKFNEYAITSLSINNLGDSVSVVCGSYRTINGQLSNGGQIFFGNKVLFEPGQAAILSGIENGSTYVSFYDAAINDARQIFVVGSIQRPKGGCDNFLASFQITVEGKISDGILKFIDGQPISIGQNQGQWFNPNRHSWEWEPNNVGDILQYSSFFPHEGGSDQVLFLNETAVFRKEVATPFAGRIGKYISAAHLNNRGDWAAIVRFIDDDERRQMLVSREKKIIESGDVLPGGGTLTHINEPIFLSDDGDTYWVGSWLAADGSSGTGLFMNDVILVEAGVTKVKDRTIKFDGMGRDLGVSDDGRHVIFSGFFEDGEGGLFHMKVSKPTEAYLFALFGVIGVVIGVIVCRLIAARKR